LKAHIIQVKKTFRVGFLHQEIEFTFVFHMACGNLGILAISPEYVSSSGATYGPTCILIQNKA